MDAYQAESIRKNRGCAAAILFSLAIWAGVIWYFFL